MQSEWKVHWLASKWNLHLEVASIWFPFNCILLLPNKDCQIPSPKQNQAYSLNCETMPRYWWNGYIGKTQQHVIKIERCLALFVKRPHPSPQNVCLLIMGWISSLKELLKMTEVKNQPFKRWDMYVLITF
jgi:hypothetical protein